MRHAAPSSDREPRFVLTRGHIYCICICLTLVIIVLIGSLVGNPAPC